MKKRKCASLMMLVVVLLLFLCGCTQESAYMGVETSDKITEFSETENITDMNTEPETTKVQFTGGEWYLSEWEKYPKLPNKEIDESLQNIYMKCPLAYEEISDGVKIRVEFFVESYQMYSFIQTRLTYTNQTDDKIVFDVNHPETLGAFKKNDRVILNPKNSKNNNYINTDAVINIALESGESFTDEVVFFMTGNFDLESGYTYTAKIYQYSSTEETKIYGITIPIEVYRAE